MARSEQGERPMSDTGVSKEPSWKRFENFEGPEEEVRTQALRAKRAREGHGGNSCDGSVQRCKMGQKVPKFIFR